MVEDPSRLWFKIRFDRVSAGNTTLTKSSEPARACPREMKGRRRHSCAHVQRIPQPNIS
jgi:hypothetical protein